MSGPLLASMWLPWQRLPARSPLLFPLVWLALAVLGVGAEG